MNLMKNGNRTYNQVTETMTTEQKKEYSDKSIIKVQSLVRKHFAVKEYKFRGKRKICAKEILSTEESYLETLQLLVQVFIVPLKNDIQPKKKLNGIVDNSDIKKCFSEIETLLGYSLSLRNDLKNKIANWTHNSTMGEIFTNFAPHLKIFSTYITTYSTRMENLNKLLNEKPKFNEWIKRVYENPIVKKKRLKIKEFLLQPVQR
eukprot:TRINITY_DN3264_c0_g1_i1.p1 TRINITY_DN3264_c0_g1~~TRINITY_DN3264_c0_g1_i1.p1  ORF type:complete len:204 (+),score=43.30 TRINITY_DN3264_c0_g1_i1:559-1170(+)